VRTQGCNWSRVLTAIAATSGCLIDQRSAVSCARGPCARYATRLRIFRTVAASQRRGNASPVESGGDLTERLRPYGLSLAYRSHDGVGVRARLGLKSGVGDGAGLG